MDFGADSIVEETNIGAANEDIPTCKERRPSSLGMKSNSSPGTIGHHPVPDRGFAISIGSIRLHCGEKPNAMTDLVQDYSDKINALPSFSWKWIRIKAVVPAPLVRGAGPVGFPVGFASDNDVIGSASNDVVTAE